MATHNCRTKTNAKKMATRYRKKGYNATVGKAKKGYNVYTSRRK